MWGGYSIMYLITSSYPQALISFLVCGYILWTEICLALKTILFSAVEYISVFQFLYNLVLNIYHEQKLLVGNCSFSGSQSVHKRSVWLYLTECRDYPCISDHLQYKNVYYAWLRKIPMTLTWFFFLKVHFILNSFAAYFPFVVPKTSLDDVKKKVLFAGKVPIWELS